MVIVLFEHALFLFCYHCLPRTHVDEYCDGGDNDMTSFCVGGVGEVHGAAVVKVGYDIHGHVTAWRQYIR